jgi:hypothetical protein
VISGSLSSGADFGVASATKDLKTLCFKTVVIKL